MPCEKVLESKKQIVADLSNKLKNSVSGVFVDYKGINVADDTVLRTNLRNAGVGYFVVKNTLTRLACNEIGLSGLDEILNGTTALAISDTDMVAPAKIISEYSKKNDFFKIKAGFIEGKVIGISEVKALADLPSKEVLISNVLRGFNAPISGLVNVLNGNIRGLAVALNAIAEKKASA